MGRVAEFFALERDERRLLIEAALALAWTRAQLVAMPFERVRRVASVAEERRSPVAREMLAGRIIRAVERASSVVPGTRNCLVRAIAARRMLARAGLRSELRIGVAKDASDGLTAHAWLDGEDGAILIGAFEPGRYIRLER